MLAVHSKHKKAKVNNNNNEKKSIPAAPNGAMQQSITTRH